MVDDQEVKETFAAIRATAVAPDVALITGESRRRRSQSRRLAGLAVAAVVLTVAGSITLLSNDGSQLATEGTEAATSDAAGSENGSSQEPPPPGPPNQAVVEPDPNCRNANTAVGADMSWILAENLPLEWRGEQAVDGTVVENPDGDLFFVVDDVQIRVHLPGEGAPAICVAWETPDISTEEPTLGANNADAASAYFGLSLEEAGELADQRGVSWRVIDIEGVAQDVDTALVPGRLNFTVDGGVVVGVQSDDELQTISADELDALIRAFGECVAETNFVEFRYRTDPFLGLTSAVTAATEDPNDFGGDEALQRCSASLDVDAQLSAYDAANRPTNTDETNLANEFINCATANSDSLTEYVAQNTPQTLQDLSGYANDFSQSVVSADFADEEVLQLFECQQAVTGPKISFGVDPSER